jgi:hypothetical protein
MKFPRLTTRRWMIAMAVIGLLLAIGRFLALRHAYRERAEFHEGANAMIFRNADSRMYWENRWSNQREGLKGSYPWPDGPPFLPAMGEYHDRMTAKWRYAADHPWLDVEPDPLR